MNFIRIAVPYLYQVGLLLMAMALPFSNFAMSFASFWILGAWVIDQIVSDHQTRKFRWSRALGNPVFWLLTGIFLIHVVGLVYTRDWTYALRDVRIKLPLILFPVVFFTGQLIEGKVFRRMLVVFVLACAAAALYCLLIPLGLIDREIKNVRDISVFISHIRFSMLLVLSTTVLLLWISERRLIILSVVVMALNISFLWVIESMTGVLLLCAVLFLFLVSTEASVLRKTQRRVLRVAVPLLFLGAGAYITKLAFDYFELPANHKEGLQTHSALGSPYEHHLENTLRENGHFIWRNIARDELAAAWPERSHLPLDSTDARGHQVYSTLLRYMTSLGLPKDAEGLSQLTTHDIANIEAGMPTILEMEHSGLRRRLDKIFFEIALLQNGGNPSGNSVTQRIEFWRAAWHVIEQKPLLGVGTGDVKSAMDDAYITIDSRLYAEFRLRAHNQYLTFWMAFGVFGMLLLMATLLIPYGVPVTERGFLFTAFCVIVALSYLTEDTLETQAGVTMVGFFSALFAAQRLAFHARIRSAT